MPISDTTIYKDRAQILSEMLATLQGIFPQVYTGEDGVLYVLYEINAAQLENLYLAHQLLLEDLWITTASIQALREYGVQYNFPMHDGTRSAGTLTFSGAGGTYIPIETQVAYDPGTGADPIYFETSTDGTLPDPGVPTAPVAALGAAGVLAGLYEYRVTFVTAAGETLASGDSNPISPSSQQVSLTAIPVGGPGTTARRIYRDKNGAGDYRRVTEISNNTTTTYTDNIADATVSAAAQIPATDTAHATTIAAQAQDTGVDGNVPMNSITALAGAPSQLSAVINPVAFTGGSDPQDTEDFRQKLLQWLQNPQTGSPNDIKAWAEEVDGVESATVFSNDNLGTPTNGHVTVRISGPGGAVPNSTVQANVLAALIEQDVANVTFHVATFTQVSTNIAVTITVTAGFALADISAAISAAIVSYVNSLEVGETLRVNGIIDAVFGLPGVDDVAVTTPATNQTTAATSKRIAGTVTVS